MFFKFLANGEKKNFHDQIILQHSLSLLLDDICSLKTLNIRGKVSKYWYFILPIVSYASRTLNLLMKDIILYLLFNLSSHYNLYNMLLYLPTFSLIRKVIIFRQIIIEFHIKIFFLLHCYFMIIISLLV